MITEKDWLLYTTKISWEATSNFQVKEWVFNVYADDILVLFRGDIVSRHISDLGDGMKIPMLLEREDIIAFNPSSFDVWLSIYTWFDENIWENKIYAYGTKDKQVDSINTMITNLWSKGSLIPWKFVEIDWLDIKEQWESLSEMLSYVLWLVTIYWNFTSIWQAISHAVIQLPLVWSIVSEEENILKIVQLLRENKMFMIIDYQAMKSGQLMQINIDDQEILDIWSEWLWWERFDQTWVLQQIQEKYWDSLDLSNYVLKFLRK